MSNKPIDVFAAQAKGRPYGRRAVWAAIRELGMFTRRELCVRLPHMNAHMIIEYLNSLIKGGYVTRGPMRKAMLSTGREREYRLTRDIGIDAPRLRKDGSELPPTGQQQMWLAMKVIGWFTPASLAGAASTPLVPVTESAAKDYIKHLLHAAYLQASGRDEKRYRLLDDTGGFAPMVQRTKVVFDPNTNRLRWHEEMEP